MEDSPLARLNTILPRLETLLLERETPSERADRATKEFLLRKLTYSNDFSAFTHTNDPLIYNSEEGVVYCKICHFYVISHTISMKGDRFYVNHSSPCSFPLTGRGFHLYDRGLTRSAFFEAHRENKNLQKSEYR